MTRPYLFVKEVDDCLYRGFKQAQCDGRHPTARHGIGNCRSNGNVREIVGSSFLKRKGVGADELGHDDPLLGFGQVNHAKTIFVCKIN